MEILLFVYQTLQIVEIIPSILVYYKYAVR